MKPGAEDDKLIARVKAFIEAHPPPDFPADRWFTSEDFRTLGYTPRKLYPVASARDVLAAEAVIGFPIPNLLKRIYMEVSNGIEGFGYHILGLDGGCQGDSGTLVKSYLELKEATEYFGRKWKSTWLPFCYWGCTIYSCVNGKDPAVPIQTWEEGEMCEEDYALPEFFKMWLKGKVRVFEHAEVVSRQIINPFTKKKTRVYARKRKIQR